MEVDAARENNAGVVSQSTAKFELQAAAFSRAKGGEFLRIVGVVLEDLQTLHDKWRQQFQLLLFRNGAVNAGRKDYSHLRRRNAHLDQATHQEVDYLRARSRTRCVGHDDQYRISAVYDFVQRRRGNWRVESGAD